MPDDLTAKDPEWWLSGASGALHRLPPGPGKDVALEYLEGCRKQLCIIRQQEQGEWSLPSPGAPKEG